MKARARKEKVDGKGLRLEPQPLVSPKLEGRERQITADDRRYQDEACAEPVCDQGPSRQPERRPRREHEEIGAPVVEDPAPGVEESIGQGDEPVRHDQNGRTGRELTQTHESHAECAGAERRSPPRNTPELPVQRPGKEQYEPEHRRQKNESEAEGCWIQSHGSRRRIG
jgi:hypothetical protein